MYLKEISLEEFQEFAIRHPLYNFFQSRGMAESQSIRNIENYALGLFDANENLVAATLCFVSLNRRFIRTMNVNYGFLIDYLNREILSSFIEQFVKFCRGKRIAKIRINPYILGFSYDEETPVKIDNSQIENIFREFGFAQLKPIVDYTRLVNLMYVKDLSEFDAFDDIVKSFQPNLQRLIKKALQYDIEISPVTYDELERYYKIECASAEKNDTSARNLAYYQSVFQGFSPIDEVLFLIATLDIKKYREEKENKKREIQENIKALNNQAPLSRKMKNKLGAEQEILDGINNRLKDIEDIPATTGIIDIGGCLALKNSNEITVLEMAQYEEFERFSPTSVIYYKLMESAFAEGIYRFNFYGTYGINDPESKGYNIYQYKKKFGGKLEQLIPEFELNLNFLAKFI
ncbi:MAG TPA: aminoacyltransferase [Clostridiaceae bacterium]|nr:aminoacyltransferase [Clostridiaceae bacterium]